MSFHHIRSIEHAKYGVFIIPHRILECEYAPKRVQIWDRISPLVSCLFLKYYDIVFICRQMCTNEVLSDKTLFPTFARTAPPISRLVPPLDVLMKHFNWNRVGIIAQNSQQWSQWNALERGLRGGGFVVGVSWTMTLGVHYNTSSLLPDFEKLLQSAAKESRSKLYLSFERSHFSVRNLSWPCLPGPRGFICSFFY